MIKRTAPLRKSRAIAKPVGGVNEKPVDGLRPEMITATAERTVNGIPVSSLPPQVASLITYEMTDQGIAESNGRKVDSKGRPHSGAKITLHEGFDQAIRQRADAIDPWDSTDPFREAAERYGRPGFRNRMLSPLLCQKRTMRGWQAVIDPQTGDPVKVGNMILGEMPVEKAERRNKKYRDEGKANQAAAIGQLREDQERAAHAGDSEGIRILRDGETLTDYGDPDRRISIGVHSSRGTHPGADAAA